MTDISKCLKVIKCLVVECPNVDGCRSHTDGDKKSNYHTKTTGIYRLRGVQRTTHKTEQGTRVRLVRNSREILLYEFPGQ